MGRNPRWHIRELTCTKHWDRHKMHLEYHCLYRRHQYRCHTVRGTQHTMMDVPMKVRTVILQEDLLLTSQISRSYGIGLEIPSDKPSRQR